MNFALFYEIFEGELLVMYWLIFLIKIFSQICIRLKEFARIVMLLLAAVSINGLKDGLY